MILFYILALTFGINAETTNSEVSPFVQIEAQPSVTPINLPPNVTEWCDGEEPILRFKDNTRVEYVVAKEDYSFALPDGVFKLNQQYSLRSSDKNASRGRNFGSPQNSLMTMELTQEGLKIREVKNYPGTKIPSEFKAPRILKPCKSNLTS